MTCNAVFQYNNRDVQIIIENNKIVFQTFYCWIVGVKTILKNSLNEITQFLIKNNKRSSPWNVRDQKSIQSYDPKK